MKDLLLNDIQSPLEIDGQKVIDIERSDSSENGAENFVNLQGELKRSISETDMDTTSKKVKLSESSDSISTPDSPEASEFTPVVDSQPDDTPSDDRNETSAPEEGMSKETPETDERSETEYPAEIVSKYLKLEALPSIIPSLPSLTRNEKHELENCLQIEKFGGWREDWIGNLAFADEDIANPDTNSREKGKQPLFRWAEKSKVGLKLLNCIIRFVYHLDETPKQAKKVLACADPTSANSIQDAVRRVSYDPIVLQEDGWTTQKSPTFTGASGCSHRIGEMVFWQGYTGVVIAYTHDDQYGDLWKAMWIEEFDTFDLEAEELDDARKKYERRKKLKEQRMLSSKPSADATRRSVRQSSADFSVKGIEHGIVLAVSYSRGSRPGVFWPARVVHFSEMTNSQSKRGKQKQKVEVVFLAPYWNASPLSYRSGRESYSETLSRHGNSIFNSGPLFELETIDASEESIQEYPYDGNQGLDIDQLRTSFKFAGLPKAAFPRFLDSHRLALALKTFSQKIMKSTPGIDELQKASAGLFEAHPISGQTADFPASVLNLPFEHILSEIPEVDSDDPDPTYNDLTSNTEPVLQLGLMLDSMKPPNCWGLRQDATLQDKESPQRISHPMPFASPSIPMKVDSINGELSSATLDRFTAGLSSLTSLFSENDDESSWRALLLKSLSNLLCQVPNVPSDSDILSTELKRAQCKALIRLWIVVKVHGEELIASFLQRTSGPYLIDWRKVCERVYKYITNAFSSKGVGNSVSWVLTDSVCNEHRTSDGCFERPVRLPAALKAAKQAGAGKSDKIQMMTSVKERYIEMAESQVIRRAHSKAYLQRIKKRCLSVPDKRDVVPLTEDSDGNGGEDTSKLSLSCFACEDNIILNFVFASLQRGQGAHGRLQLLGLVLQYRL